MWIVIGVLVLGAAATVGLYFLERHRRAEVTEAAGEQGFTPLGESDLEALKQHWDLEGWPFGVGHSRTYTFGVRGEWDGRPALLADYQYKTRSGSGENRRTTTHHVAVTAVQIPVQLPRLEVSPEGVVTRALGSITNSDIDLEWEDFNRAFVVECPDRGFASAFLTPQMMEHLMSLDDVAFQIAGSDVLICTAGKHRPDDLVVPLRTLDGIVDRIPEHLLHPDGGGR